MSDKPLHDFDAVPQLSWAEEAIASFRAEIDAHYAALHDKVCHIQERAKNDEKVAIERAHAEIAPVRRQMEAMVLNLARYRELASKPRDHYET